MKLSRRHIIFTVISVALGAILVLCLYAYNIVVTYTLADEYAQLESLIDAQETRAYVPSAENNPVRQRVNRLLGEVLATGFTQGQRRERAEEGLRLLELMELQIDGIGEATQELDAAIVDIQKKSPFTDEYLRSGGSELIRSLERRSEIIADIRGLSYRANFHTAEIFSKILQDNGELTSEHVLALNDQIPQVEEQFYRRSNLYNELEDLDITIGQTLDRLQETSLLMHAWNTVF